MAIAALQALNPADCRAPSVDQCAANGACLAPDHIGALARVAEFCPGLGQELFHQFSTFPKANP